MFSELRICPNGPSSFRSKFQMFLQAVEGEILQGRTSSVAKSRVLLWMRHFHKNAHKTLKEVNDKARLYYGTEDHIMEKVSRAIQRGAV